jgi:hypothetical protein
MMAGRSAFGVLVAAIIAVTAICAAAPVAAEPNDVALNGTFVAFSDGQWSKTRERFEPRPSVTSVWTLTSSCTNFQECTGTLVSDQGWSAPLLYQSQSWRARHVIPGWLKCPDGSTADGTQTFTFWARRLDAPDRFTQFVGFDETIGPSGACGVNRWMNVRMPLTVTRR